MPVSEPSGRAFIWLVACFLLISIIAGGGCLVAYMVLPESKTASWIPHVGVTLVCLPWAFWTCTFFYRIFSRCCGCRFQVGVGIPNGGDGAAAKHVTGNADLKLAAQANGDRGMGVSQRGLDRASSAASHESQMPLASSMAS